MASALNAMDSMKEYLDKIAHLELENERLIRQNARLQEKLNAALDSNGLCLWEQHIPTGSLTIFNMKWGKMLGYQPGELSATVETWKSNLHPDDYDLAVGAFEDHLAGKTDLYEVVHRMTHKNGSDSWVHDRGRIVEYDKNGAPLRMMGTHIDITQEKRFEQQLAKLASTDPLTGLSNRSAIVEAFYHRASHNTKTKLAMVFIDIDNFKAVNDNLGHQVGDKLLVTLANKLNGYSPIGAQVGRLGGDEFVLLHTYTQKRMLTHLCDQLLTTVISEINSSLDGVGIGMSIGVCLFQAGDHPFETIYQNADTAMYEIKKNGKNGVKVIDMIQDESSHRPVDPIPPSDHSLA